MGEPVQQRPRQPFGSEGLGPFVERKVAGHQRGTAFVSSAEDLKQQLIEVAESASVEQVCMISFIPMEGNAQLIKLLDGTFAGRGSGAPEPKPIDAVAALTFVPSEEIPSRTQKSS